MLLTAIIVYSQLHNSLQRRQSIKDEEESIKPVVICNLVVVEWGLRTQHLFLIKEFVLLVKAPSLLLS